MSSELLMTPEMASVARLVCSSMRCKQEWLLFGYAFRLNLIRSVDNDIYRQSDACILSEFLRLPEESPLPVNLMLF